MINCLFKIHLTSFGFICVALGNFKNLVNLFRAPETCTLLLRTIKIKRYGAFEMKKVSKVVQKNLKPQTQQMKVDDKEAPQKVTKLWPTPPFVPCDYVKQLKGDTDNHQYRVRNLQGIC